MLSRPSSPSRRSPGRSRRRPRRRRKALWSRGRRRASFSCRRETDDAVFHAILDDGRRAPATIFELRKILEGLGGELETHIVANRGFDNPEAGSFSFFESYTGPLPKGRANKGDLFVGFFSERQGDRLAVQQSFEPGLMIELIAWDFTRKVYDFWELVGNGSASEWHFRGDSNDILSDISEIGVGAARPAFGKRLRCSGCHTLGGPVMKELAPPHNDWWSTAHKLKLGTILLAPGPDGSDPVQLAGKLFAGASDGWNLGQQVQLGLDRLMQARAERSGDGQDLPRQLRPLFETMEMNLVSDREPFLLRQGGRVEIPEAFFVDPRLAGDADAVSVDAGLYRRALTKIGSRFAPDEALGLAETRHAHLVPARSYADNQAVTSLVRTKMADDELVDAVLAVDFTTPVYSRPRASLLKYVPGAASGAAELRTKLVGARRRRIRPAPARTSRSAPSRCLANR